MTSDLLHVVEQSDILFSVVPSAYLHQTFSFLPPHTLENKKVISATKGLLPHLEITPTQYFERCHNVPIENLAMVGGPCHAEEIAWEKLSYLTIVSQNQSLAQEIAGILKCHYLLTNTGTDVHGVEYAAVFKNIISIAAGICHGLDYGDNFQAVLISEGARETARFVQKISPTQRDIIETAYLGDLLVSAYSLHSRNRQFGNMIGKGYSVQSAQLEMRMVAEGYSSTASVYNLNKKVGVEIPIVDSVYHILYGKESPAVEIRTLAEILK